MQRPFSDGRVSTVRLMDSSRFFADKIVQSKMPVLIDFWAAWCGPCRFLNPTIDDLKKEYAGKVLVMKVNVDIHRTLAAYFRVSSIPAVFLITNKTVVDYLPGLQPKELYKRALDKVLFDSKEKSSGETKRTNRKPDAKEKPDPAEEVTASEEADPDNNEATSADTM